MQSASPTRCLASWPSTIGGHAVKFARIAATRECLTSVRRCSILLMAVAFAIAAAAPAPPALSQAPPERAAAEPASVSDERRLGYVFGSDLLARCTEGSVTSTSYCFGYVAAVFDSVRSYEVWQNMREFCVPQTATLSDLRATVVGYLQRHQERLDGQAGSLVVLALRDAYPCAGSDPAP